MKREDSRLEELLEDFDRVTKLKGFTRKELVGVLRVHLELAYEVGKSDQILNDHSYLKDAMKREFERNS